MRKHTLKATYDFEKHGGAVGDIALGVFLPKGAYVRGAVLVDEETNVTSDGAATIAINAKEFDADKTNLVAATALSGISSMVELDLAATAIKMTETKEVVITVAVAALTAGKVHFIIEYDK